MGDEGYSSFDTIGGYVAWVVCNLEMRQLRRS